MTDLRLVKDEPEPEPEPKVYIGWPTGILILTILVGAWLCTR